MRHAIRCLVIGGLLLTQSLPIFAQDLRGSRASLNRQNMMARSHNFTYLRTPQGVRRFVQAGYLVPVMGSDALRLEGVSFPYARPEVRLFLERLSRQYKSACGEPLIVTSLTRPLSHQPRNASPRSVHPTGMAADLRRSQNPRCRQWLERVLLQLESSGIVEATYERSPPHYHVAVFPRPYRNYLTRINAQVKSVNNGDIINHTVSRGESLWLIARKYSTTVNAIQQANNLRSSIIHPGQVIKVPVNRTALHGETTGATMGKR